MKLTTMNDLSVSIKLKLTPKLHKDSHAFWNDYRRLPGIKRTRKRQIAKAKHMMDFHDHTSYEWSQWWMRHARKPKRWSN